MWPRSRLEDWIERGIQKLQLDDSSLERDGCCVGSIAGAELGKDASHPALDRFLGGGELIGDLLVGAPCGNEAQDADLRRRERIIGRMLNNFQRSLRGDGLLTPMGSADGVE